MTALDRGWITTAITSPISFVRYNDGDSKEDIWFVYMFGDRIGSATFGRHTVYYRPRYPHERNRLYVSFSEMAHDLERSASLVAVANAHLIGDGARS